MWLHGLSILWMCKKCADPAHCDHMTQYILNVITKEWLKHLLITFFGKFKKYWVYADGAHCGHMIQYFLNILTTYWARKLQIHCSAYSERTQHVLVQESVGILDMEPPCTKHVLAQYRGVCPQCDPQINVHSILWIMVVLVTNRQIPSSSYLDGDNPIVEKTTTQLQLPYPIPQGRDGHLLWTHPLRQKLDDVRVSLDLQVEIHEALGPLDQMVLHGDNPRCGIPNTRLQHLKGWHPGRKNIPDTVALLLCDPARKLYLVQPLTGDKPPCTKPVHT